MLRKVGVKLMANIKSAKKRIRVIETKTAKNKRIKTRLKDILKRFDDAVDVGDKEEAREMLALAEKKLMQAASKGTLHKNTAARKVSRITKKFLGEFGADALTTESKDKKATKTKAKKADKKEKAVVEEKVEEKTEEPKDEEVSENESAPEEEKAEEKADAPEEEKAEEPKKKTTRKKSTKKESAEEAEEK